MCRTKHSYHAASERVSEWAREVSLECIRFVYFHFYYYRLLFFFFFFRSHVGSGVRCTAADELRMIGNSPARNICMRQWKIWMWHRMALFLLHFAENRLKNAWIYAVGSLRRNRIIFFFFEHRSLPDYSKWHLFVTNIFLNDEEEKANKIFRCVVVDNTTSYCHLLLNYACMHAWRSCVSAPCKYAFQLYRYHSSVPNQGAGTEPHASDHFIFLRKPKRKTIFCATIDIYVSRHE